MAEVFTVQARITGFTGGPGINTFVFTNGGLEDSLAVPDAVSGLRAFYTAMKPYFISAQRIQFTGEAKFYDLASGLIQRVITYDPGSEVLGSDTQSATSRATQAKLRFYTDTVVGRRFLQGGIYFGPLSDAGITTGGQVDTAVATAAANGLDALISGVGAKLQVWKRPKSAAGGAAGDVVSVGVMPSPAVLRSRRD